MFGISISLTVAPCAALVLPIPTYINRLESNTNDSIFLRLSKTQHIPQTLELNQFKGNKITMTNNNIHIMNKINIDNLFSIEETIVAIRGGNLITDIIEFIIKFMSIELVKTIIAAGRDANAFNTEPPKPDKLMNPSFPKHGFVQGTHYNPLKSSSSTCKNRMTSTALQLFENPFEIQINKFISKDGVINLDACFMEVRRRANKLGQTNFDCSFQIFKDLATDAELNQITPISAKEAISALNGEMLGYYTNARKIDYGEEVTGLDFMVDGIGKFQHITHLELKNPVGVNLSKKNADTLSGTIDRIVKQLLRKVKFQKIFWPKTNTDIINKLPKLDLLASRPETPSNILMLFDLFDVQNVTEKSLLQEGLTEGLNNDLNILFINNNNNI